MALTKDKIQLLKSGVYGVTRNGQKALYAGEEEKTMNHRWLVFKTDNSNMPSHFETYAFFLKNEPFRKNDLDIVDLWENRIKELNIELVLKNKTPVKLRNGEKAFVLHDVSKVLELVDFPFVGITEKGKPVSWNEDGKSSANEDKHYHDIVDMWN